MRILIAPDSFKESLSALQVSKAIKSGFSKVFPQASYDLLPLGDGGEGTVESLAHVLKLTPQLTEVTGAFGELTQVTYALRDDMAVFEMADIVGLEKIPMGKRNPLNVRTHGVGELILHLIERGVKHILIGIGGSASHDGGIGMAAGLGVQFFDEDGKIVEAIGSSIGRITNFSTALLSPSLKGVQIELITDVDNPLCGPNGATFVFAGQKGLPLSDFDKVDSAMQSLYELINPDIIEHAGAGAGGGMAAGLVHFAGAEIRKGIDFVLDKLNFDEKVKKADLVIVGEGRMDRQSLAGKTPIGVARRTPKNIPIIAICGSLANDLPAFPIETIRAAFPIIAEIRDVQETLARAEENISRTAEQVARIVQLAKEVDNGPVQTDELLVL